MRAALNKSLKQKENKSIDPPGPSSIRIKCSTLDTSSLYHWTCCPRIRDNSPSGSMPLDSDRYLFAQN